MDRFVTKRFDDFGWHGASEPVADRRRKNFCIFLRDLLRRYLTGFCGYFGHTDFSSLPASFSFGRKMTEYTPIHFLDEHIYVSFDSAPLHEKSPHCPNSFLWNE